LAGILLVLPAGVEAAQMTRAERDRRRKANRKWYHRNRKQNAARQRRWNRANPERVAFYMAKRRCTNRSSPGWKYWGGRRVKFLFKSFEQFFAEVGKRPSRKHSLDRWPDNDGHYEPGNVRWATRKEQNFNRRPRRRS
jgi:hypothetical protein